VDSELLKLIDDGCELTKNNEELTLIIAFNYGGRGEIAKAAKQVAQRVLKGEIDPDAIDVSVLDAHLDTAGLPDPDLLIRTSGEIRLSNFLLWQCAYTEFVFLEENWPEFGRSLLEKAIDQFRARDRRYGGLSRRSTA
ncbi:MAG: polyprenyl diphosphate synthase, partial [Pseudomonadota bacterium]